MLSDVEREIILKSARQAAGTKKIAAVAAYGSKVAGYARPDSDYDLIVAVDKLRPRAKYIYGEVEGNEYSALLVEERALLQDATEASLGEFVAGRLLNAHEALQGPEYLRVVEDSLKRRVVLEAISELFDRYDFFAEQMLIPPSYFLFEKLKKRAFVYPPVLYSYVRTYSPPLRDANVKSALSGFGRVLSELERDGFIRRRGEYFTLTPEASLKIRSPRFAVPLRVAERGIKQYIAHGFAGMVGPNTAFRELTSKISRSRALERLPPELEEPKSVIRLPHGRLVFSSDWIKDAMDELGIQAPYHYKTESMGDFFSAATLYTIKHPGGETKIVAKKFKDFWSFKWVVANLMTVTAKQFEARPLQRLAREYKGSVCLKEAGALTPRIVLVAPDESVIVKEYIVGENLEPLTRQAMRGDRNASNKVRQFAEVLGRIHSMGYALGDSKPSNFLVNAQGINIVDLEQSEEGGEQPWDIVEYLYYSAITAESPEAVVHLVRVFKSGYSKTGPISNLIAATASKYALPFQILVQPPVAIAIRKELEAY
jgi:tRNA A-37 threonylcarbamoyl transferase component Bud32